MKKIEIEKTKNKPFFTKGIALMAFQMMLNELTELGFNTQCEICPPERRMEIKVYVYNIHTWRSMKRHPYTKKILRSLQFYSNVLNQMCYARTITYIFEY